MVEPLNIVMIVVPAFVLAMAGIVTWRRVRTDKTDAEDMRAWIHANTNPNPAPRGPAPAMQTRPEPTPAPPPPHSCFPLRRTGVFVQDLGQGVTGAEINAMRATDELVLLGTPAETMRDVLVEPGAVRVLQPGDTIEQVRVMPVVLVTELFDRATRLRIEFHGRQELLEWAWVAESDWTPQTLRVGGNGPLTALQMLTNAMVREKHFPESGSRRVMVRVRTVKNAVAEFEVDVNQPAWMVQMAAQLRELE